MHENLRTSFKLTKSDIKWQKITSDFAYGTFFSIYAKFNYSEDKFIPTSCSIKIQNYNGSVTIGIDSVENKLKFIYDSDIKEYVYYLQINLKPLHTINEVTVENLSFEDFRKSSFKEDKSILGEFRQNSILFIALEYVEINDSRRPDINNIPLVDTTRYLRDGDQLHKVRLESLSQVDDLSKSMIGIYNLIDSMDEIKIYYDTVYIRRDENDNFFLKSRPCRDLYVLLNE